MNQLLSRSISEVLKDIENERQVTEMRKLSNMVQDDKAEGMNTLGENLAKFTMGATM